MPLQVAVDIGGTFTDMVVFDESSGEFSLAKSSTTPQDLILGVSDCLRKASVTLPDVQTVVHGSTIAINTVLQRNGAKVGLLTTCGFRDVLEIGRTNRPDPYNLRFRRLPPLVPRDLRLEVRERVDYSGRIRVPLDPEQVRPLIARLKQEEVEGVAVCLLHAYANPEHEVLLGELLAAEMPTVYISLSHVLTREFREYERTSSTVINAYVGPRVGTYIARLKSALRAKGFGGNLYVMQSSGGLMSLQSARVRPSHTMESGPVAGVMGAAHVGAMLGEPNIIGFDMGGTTAKAAVLTDGHPEIVSTYYIAGYDAGYPLQAPVVDIVEVGAGGGSIAWVDQVGSLTVGPTSAGASPGPVCYGQGGTEPTVTDANLILGRLNPDFFLGGELKLDACRARQAMEDRVATPLNHDPVEMAAGVTRIANLIMASAVRRVTIERGRDPRLFTLVAYGGAGPLHAAAIARELSIPRVVIPPAPAHFCALGMLLTDLRHDTVRTWVRPLHAIRDGDLAAVLHEMKADALAELPPEARSGGIQVLYHAEMRYCGQEHTIRVPLPADVRRSNALREIRQTFHAVYLARYGYDDEDGDIEFVHLRVALICRKEGATLARLAARLQGNGRRASPAGRRQVYFDDLGYVECPIYRREALTREQIVRGPAIIEEYASTTVLHPGDVARSLDHGFLAIEIGGKRGETLGSSNR